MESLFIELFSKAVVASLYMMQSSYYITCVQQSLCEVQLQIFISQIYLQCFDTVRAYGL